jgi:formamidopyrimidine-DNA glycosylase
MPELPEVETLKRELNRALVGKEFARAEIFWLGTIKPLAAKKFNDLIKNKEIISVERRAKILILKLSGQINLLVHLKMTGQLVFKNIIGGHPEDPTKYTRVIFTFTDGSVLRFNDLRKFGWIKIVNETDLPKLFVKTGVEPLGKEFALTKFTGILERYPKRKLKQLLLDQTLIAGLGNIYVDESCFSAKVLPTRIAGSLTAAEIGKLHAGIISVLKLSISKKGTSSRNYVRANGQPGGMVPHLNVYGRGKEKCKICSEKISKIKLNGRGTHFCSKCQK